MSFWAQVAIQSSIAGLVVGLVSYFASKKSPEHQRKAVIITVIIITAMTPFWGPKWSDNQPDTPSDQSLSGVNSKP